MAIRATLLFRVILDLNIAFAQTNLFTVTRYTLWCGPTSF